MQLQYVFYFDSTRCTGCRTCMVACQDYKGLEAGTALRRVYDYEGGSWEVCDDGTWLQDSFVYHLSLSCNHCGAPACVQVCPTGAMHRDDETGLVLVDDRVCVGCGYCQLACPYNAPHVSPVKHQCVKCDGCRDRVLEGLLPVCVQACPLRCLDFGPAEDIVSRPGCVDAIAPMPDSHYTMPNVVIRPCKAARAPGDTDGHVANLREVKPERA